MAPGNQEWSLAKSKKTKTLTHSPRERVLSIHELNQAQPAHQLPGLQALLAQGACPF